MYNASRPAPLVRSNHFSFGCAVSAPWHDRPRVLVSDCCAHRDAHYHTKHHHHDTAAWNQFRRHARSPACCSRSRSRSRSHRRSKSRSRSRSRN